MEEVLKDVYNPVSDMDILKTLGKKPRKAKKLKLSNDGMSLRMKLGLVFIWGLVSILALTFIGLSAIKAVDDFFDENTFAYHWDKVVEVKLAFPVTIEKRTPQLTYIKVADTKQVLGKKLTQEEKAKVIASSNYPKIIKGIGLLETDLGRNPNKTAHHNECDNLGMTNDFGYRALDNYCFNSYEEAVKTVDKWIDEQLQTKTISETLCYYSSGKAESTCDYAQNYKALEKAGSLALK